jgi:hypothetical protein
MKLDHYRHIDPPIHHGIHQSFSWDEDWMVAADQFVGNRPGNIAVQFQRRAVKTARHATMAPLRELEDA